MTETCKSEAPGIPSSSWSSCCWRPPAREGSRACRSTPRAGEPALDRGWKSREGEERPEEVAAMRSWRSCASTASQLGGEGWCLKVLNLNSTAIFYTATDHCSWMARRIYKRGYLKDLDLWALHNHGFPFLGIEDPQKLGNLSPALRGWSLEAFWNNGFFKNIFWVLTTFIYATLSNTLFKIRRQWQSHKMSNHFITNILDKIFFLFFETELLKMRRQRAVTVTLCFSCFIPTSPWPIFQPFKLSYSLFLSRF